MRRIMLNEDCVVAGLQADDFKGVLRKLVQIIPEWKMDESMKRKALKDLVAREAHGTTAVGRGIALPHCFFSDITEPIIVFGVSADGVSYPSLDGRPVHFIFMLLLPPDKFAEQTKRAILRNVVSLLRDRALQDKLKLAQSSSEVADLIAVQTGGAAHAAEVAL